MSPVEERLRAAANAVADVITEESAPPLRLAEPRRHPSGASRAWRRRRAAWAAPLAAAAAVIAVAMAGLAAARAWPLPSQPAAVPAGPAGTPAWYVTLTGRPGTGDAQAASATTATVRSSSTGRVLATYSPPQPYTSFDVVTAAAAGTTFVLGAERIVTASATAGGKTGFTSVTYTSLNPVRVTQFYQLNWTGAGGGTSSWSSLSAVQAPVETKPVTGAALSPDGRKLAVAMSSGTATGAAQLSVQVTTLATGATRTWSGTSWTTPGDLDPESGPAENTLSWAGDDQTLAVDWPGPAGDDQARHVSGSLSVSLLDTTTPGAGLTEYNSSSALPDGYGMLYPGDVLLAADGAAMTGVLNRARPGGGSQTMVATWSPDGGPVRQVRSRGLAGGVPLRVLWANSTGSVLIVAAEPTAQVTGSTGSGYATGPGGLRISKRLVLLPSTSVTSTPADVGVLTGGQFIPLARTGLTLGDLETAGNEIAW